MLPQVSGLGQEFEPSNRSTGVLILFSVSPVVMLFSNIASAVSETNEGHQLSFGRKCIMGSYLLLQLFPHLFWVIPTVLASLPCIANPPCLPDEQPALSSRNAYLLITAPFLTNYMINLILMPKRIQCQTKSLKRKAVLYWKAVLYSWHILPPCMIFNAGERMNSLSPCMIFHAREKGIFSPTLHDI